MWCCNGGNILEKVIFDSRHDFFINKKFVIPIQSGFIKGDLCVNQLLLVAHKTLDANLSTHLAYL